MPNSSAKSIAVLGAGITGLTAAHRLVQRGHRVRVFEASDRVGGAIRTERTADGWLIESGPNTVIVGEPALASLIDELGLAAECVGTQPAAKNRFIVRHGRPVALPLSPPALLASPLFSLGAKSRILAEVATRPRVRSGDIALEDFIRAHFGQEIADYALNPFVTGIWAGDPKKLSTRHAFPALWEMERTRGSLLRGQIAAAKKARAAGAAGGIFSFHHGLQTLPDALAARLPADCLVLRARVEALTPGAQWSVIWHNGTATHTGNFDAVVATLPASGLATLRFGLLGERPLASLAAIPHPPVSALFLGYRRDQVAHALDGFGLLVPAVEQRSLLGVLFSSTLFPGRAPAGHVALTVLVGGTRQPEIARLGADEILARITPDLAQLLGVGGAPVFRRHVFWPRAIPQYDLGHERHLAAITEAERTHPNFFVGGQVCDGIALPACLAAGEKLAARAEGGRGP